MHWHNEPPVWQVDGANLTVTTAAGSDYWRKTHYGFIRANGHFYASEVAGDFVADVAVRGAYHTLYDQAGLMLWVDEENWLKCGIEYVDGVQYASAVVTRDYSDWAVSPLAESPATVYFRVTRSGTAVEIHYSLDGGTFELLRVTYLPMQATVQIGPMCASPGESGFDVGFEGFQVESMTSKE